MAIVLASASPRRRELMEMFAAQNLVICPAKGEEKVPAGATPGETVEALARAKAREIAAARRGESEDDVIIGADTIVWFQNRVFGKPHSPEEAAAMLHSREQNETLTKVIDDLNEVLKRSPKNIYATYNKGCVYLLLNDYTSAINCFSTCIDIKPDLGEAYYNRGLTYLRLGNRERGVADLSKAGELGILPSYNVLKRINR